MVCVLPMFHTSGRVGGTLGALTSGSVLSFRRPSLLRESLEIKPHRAEGRSRMQQLGDARMAGVGSQRLFENDQVVVWDFILEPGEASPIHTHEHDYMYCVIEGSQLVLSDAVGAVLGEFAVATGAVFELKLDGETIKIVSEAFNGFTMPVTHRVANIGTFRYREILVETKLKVS